MLGDRRTLTKEQIAFYRENGFVQVDDVLSAEELEELRECLSEALEDAGGRSVQTSASDSSYYKVLNQRVNTWRDHGGMARFVLGSRFADMGRQLVGGGVRLFHDHALLKMPRDSKPTPWHQDKPYWPMRESGAFSIWIALDDVDERNGCMMFVPKTQKIKNLKSISLAAPEDIFADSGAKDVDRNTAVLMRLRAGSCTFHDGFTFHYAHANATDRPRRALAIIFMPDGTTYSGSRHICTDGLGFEVGKPLAGGLFPKLA